MSQNLTAWCHSKTHERDRCRTQSTLVSHRLVLQVQAASSPAPAPQASPLTRYQVPKTSKLPQSQADLAVYVRSPLLPKIAS